MSPNSLLTSLVADHAIQTRDIYHVSTPGVEPPDDFVILTVDLADSPIAELRLTEIYNVETSTVNDDYLLIFQEYVTLQLENTYGLGNRSKSRMLDARLCTLHRRANGNLFSLRKPAMERLIRQTIQNRVDALRPVSVSILIQFKMPGFRIPRRLHDSARIPSKISGMGSNSSSGSEHMTAATFLQGALDLLCVSAEPGTLHVVQPFSPSITEESHESTMSTTYSSSVVCNQVKRSCSAQSTISPLVADTTHLTAAGAHACIATHPQVACLISHDDPAKHSIPCLDEGMDYQSRTPLLQDVYNGNHPSHHETLSTDPSVMVVMDKIGVPCPHNKAAGALAGIAVVYPSTSPLLMMLPALPACNTMVVLANFTGYDCSNAGIKRSIRMLVIMIYKPIDRGRGLMDSSIFAENNSDDCRHPRKPVSHFEGITLTTDINGFWSPKLALPSCDAKNLARCCLRCCRRNEALVSLTHTLLHHDIPANRSWPECVKSVNLRRFPLEIPVSISATRHINECAMQVDTSIDRRALVQRWAWETSFKLSSGWRL